MNTESRRIVVVVLLSLTLLVAWIPAALAAPTTADGRPGPRQESAWSLSGWLGQAWSGLRELVVGGPPTVAVHGEGGATSPQAPGNDAGGGMDPDGLAADAGGGMDPNGLAADAGSGMDPNG